MGFKRHVYLCIDFLIPGAEGFTSEEDQEMISRIEKQVKRRFVIGSQVSEHAIVQDFLKQVSDFRFHINIPELLVKMKKDLFKSRLLSVLRSLTIIDDRILGVYASLQFSSRMYGMNRTQEWGLFGSILEWLGNWLVYNCSQERKW